ncbi:membrane-spanning 4-domains subfamily A member 4A-like isoform X2 [Nerophis ophidion]|uniref:membrane-spanning 4-domains subfamily A member 4A-like isoform X2 n=1 Tax=Nerophis ophidion TaxID=159077 RepID=UPI002ADF480A|nr:membrane-spanning 4-domains subfamily A member 4A-like isoform X2 [Nerophis ophidion]
MADEVHVLESNQNPLVTVSFQRDANRKQKYLEAEPKALGITSTSVFHSQNHGTTGIDVTFIILSILVVIAGSVAIASKNLHLPLLKACLGMQIVACLASFVNIICILMNYEQYYYTACWHYAHGNQTTYSDDCHILERTRSHLFGESILIQVTLMAISATLASYCCKVVNCCAPAPKMPVITLQTQPAEQ